MKQKSIPEISEDSLILTDYLRAQKPGQILSYHKIGNDTKVTMNNKGKQILRRALKRANLEYSCIKGQGIKIAEAEDTMPIVINKLTKIDKAVKRAEKTHKNLYSKFFDELDEKEQKQLLYIGAAFGAIRLASENGKMIYSSRKEISHSIEIPLPDF